MTQASQAPAHLIITGRTPSKLQESIDAMKADYPDVDYRVLEVDLGKQQRVRKAAAELLAWTDIPTIDIVVNNAGIMNVAERTINEDGLEITWATNHIGHFLLTCLVMPKILKAAQNNAKGTTRIINVTSRSPTVTVPRFSDLNFEVLNRDLPQAEQPAYHMHRMFGQQDTENKAYVPVEAYSQSKVGNVLFSVGLNQRLFEKYGVLSLAVHPGIIKTELSREATAETKQAIDAMGIDWRTLGAGASTSLTAATDPKLGLPVAKPTGSDGKENVGIFLMDCQISDTTKPGAASSANAERIWKISEDQVKEQFSW